MYTWSQIQTKAVNTASNKRLVSDSPKPAAAKDGRILAVCISPETLIRGWYKRFSRNRCTEPEWQILGSAILALCSGVRQSRKAPTRLINGMTEFGCKSVAIVMGDLRQLGVF